MISRERLHQANRHARRRFRVLRWGRGSAAWMYEPEPVLWQRYRKLTTGCSYYCCGNPRRHFGQVTVQERRYMEVS